jgi:hypothetical protein
MTYQLNNILQTKNQPTIPHSRERPKLKTTYNTGQKQLDARPRDYSKANSPL